MPDLTLIPGGKGDNDPYWNPICPECGTDKPETIDSADGDTAAESWAMFSCVKCAHEWDVGTYPA